jgi:hypothetical protein
MFCALIFRRRLFVATGRGPPPAPCDRQTPPTPTPSTTRPGSQPSAGEHQADGDEPDAATGDDRYAQFAERRGSMVRPIVPLLERTGDAHDAGRSLAGVADPAGPRH